MLVKQLYWVLIAVLCSACASNSQSLLPSSNRFGVVVNSALMHDTTTKSGIELISDTGRHMNAHAELSAGNRYSNSTPGGTSGYGGIGLPKWVDVSWREPIYGKKYIPITGKTTNTLDFGKKLGDYRVEVASRIPQEVLQYASAEKGRAIKLMFRILDDDVVLGWCVQESSNKGGGWIYSRYGGDFVPASWYNGKLMSMGWYVDKKTGQRIETTTGH
jgi:hypothetical protein